MSRGRLAEALAFGRTASLRYAEIVAGREASGRPISVADGQIAAACRACEATLATRNVRDFEDVGITVVDPWTAQIGTDVEPPAPGS